MIHFKQKPAFTLIELVFVIVVLGILASLALPHLDADKKQEAADAILSDIRYTQHLALLDDKHSFYFKNWQKSFWRIGFENCAHSTGIYEYIGSDINRKGDINDNEAATDPANGKKMNWINTVTCNDGGNNSTSSRIFITHKYGVKKVIWEGRCSNAQYIGFDHLGRPHQGFAGKGGNTPDFSTYLTDICTIIFTMSDNHTFKIIIAPETGYAYIEDQNAS